MYSCIDCCRCGGCDEIALTSDCVCWCMPYTAHESCPTCCVCNEYCYERSRANTDECICRCDKFNELDYPDSSSESEYVHEYDTNFDCIRSINMENCTSCDDCTGCINCYNCDNCDNCVDCVDCVDCIDCVNCVGCVGCVGCVNSTDCAKKKKRK